MNLREVFAANLRKLRHERGMSQEELAFRAKISRGYMSDLERSSYSATLDMIERLARALGVQPSELLEHRTKRRV